jgi:Holliday junction resolvase-like predicted endonuclease
MSRSVAERKAHEAAKLYLEMRGYSIIEQNWRRSRVTIDIVAKKDDTVYLVSVHYAPNANDSSHPVELMTKSKLDQRLHAQEVWLEEEKWHGRIQLASIEITDPNFAVLSFSDSLS